MFEKSFHLFKQLMENFKETTVKARLIAQINFLRMNDKHEVIGNEDYHFTSYSQETVSDVEEFYERHMQKIASRLDSFHENGSRLLINQIKHIHIALSVCQ